MHPGPLVQPSRRRPPRRQHPHLHQQQLHREHNRQQQQQQERCRSCLLSQPRGHGSRAFLVLLLLASNPLAQTVPVIPESPMALATSMTHYQQAPTISVRSGSNAIIQPLNLTIGYLTAIKGGLKDRQGLAISGAITMALDEVKFTIFRALPLANFSKAILPKKTQNKLERINVNKLDKRFSRNFIFIRCDLNILR